MGLKTRLAAERAFLSEDIATASEAARAWFTPARKSAIAVCIGVVLVVIGLALWSTVVALVAAGAAFLVYGAVLVDLDVSPTRRKRKKKVIE